MRKLPAVLLIFCLLSACAPAHPLVIATLTPTPVATSAPLETAALPTDSPTPVPFPILKQTVTPTLEPDIILTKIREWRGHSLPVAWSKDSKRFALVLDRKLELYNTSLKLLWEQPSSAEMSFASAITFSVDDKFIIVYQAGTGIKLFDVNSGKLVAESRDSNCLIDADIRHLDAYPRNMISSSNTLFVGFAGNNKYINEQPIQFSAWTLKPLRCQGKIIKVPSGSALVTTMSLNPNNDYLVAVSTQGWIKVWDTNNYNQICETSGLYAIFRPSNGLLAVVSGEGDTLSYWDVEKCELAESIKIPQYKFEQEMAFTPDGKYLIMRRASFDIFDATNGELRYKDKINLDEGSGSLAISPDGKYFLSDYLENEPVTALWQIDRK